MHGVDTPSDIIGDFFSFVLFLLVVLPLAWRFITRFDPSKISLKGIGRLLLTLVVIMIIYIIVVGILTP